MREEQNNKKARPNKPILVRCVAIGAAFVLMMGWLSLDLAHLQIDQGDEWSARASGQQLRSTPIQPARGNIYDTNMQTLAYSAPVWTVVASPDVLAKSRLNENAPAGAEPARLAAEELARILELDVEAIYPKLADAASRFYEVLAKIEKPLADEVRAVCEHYNIKGITLQQDARRYYPYEELCATVLGFVGRDNEGLEGLERQYNSTLAGTPGRLVTVRDAFGNEMPTDDAGMTYPAEEGYSIVLTIDAEIQQILEKYLAQAVAEHQVKERGMGIVMDPNTGAILAMATVGSYNPNDPYALYDTAARDAIAAIADDTERSAAQGAARTLQWRNKPVADTYEPGSVFKVITAAAALDSGTYTENSTFSCGSQIEIADRTFRCAQGTNHGTETLRGALIDSCNVSFIRMSAGMGQSTWYHYLNAFGLTEPTGIDLPGEPRQAAINNLVYAEDALGPVQLASCSFGQSNKYTALQMITAVSAAINGGNLMQPYLVRQILDAEGNVVQNFEPVVKRQVISEETSAILRSTMEQLVADPHGFGKNAYVAGYHVGGKSGTSQKLELLTQENREEYISSFLGFAPADHPELAVLIVLDEPEDPTMGTYFGGRLAGPTVREVLRESLPIVGVEPEYDTADDLARTTVSCPNFVGENMENALVLINQKNLTYRRVGDGDTVVGQFPAAYSLIPYGGQVVLYTDASIPVENAAVPDVLGQSPQKAMEALRNAGFNVLTTGAPDNGSGVVVSAQSIAPGTETPKGTVITLTMEDVTNVSDV